MGSTNAALRQLVKASAAAVDVVRRPEPGVVILIYHRIGGTSGLAIDLPVARFEAQMAWLASTRRVVRLGQALRTATDGGRETASGAPGDGPRPVVVTFDDGTADFVDHALPILERYRIPVTLYAATAFLDDQRAFPDDGTPLSWGALRAACAGGLVDVGSHTHRHVLLDRLPAVEIDAELDRSIESIGAQLGVAPLDFAYPKAVLGSRAAERAVRARFRSAAIAGTRPNPFGATNPYRLARTPIQVGDGSRWFAHKVGGGMRFEDDLRQLLNRRRYLAATT